MKILFSCKHIPKEAKDGDVVIAKDDHFFRFYYIANSECRLLEKVKTIKFIQGNITCGTAFEYSDLAPRKGNQELLRFFISIFKKQIIVDYLRNAYDILLYKEDKWNASILQSLLLAKEYSEERANRNSFIDFLDAQARDYLLMQMKNGCTISDAYRLTKQTYPKMFSQSLKQFKTVYPTKSIYDDTLMS